MKLAALVPFAAALAVAAGAAASPAPVPGAPPFVVRVVRETIANRYGPLWDELHPAQQAVLPRAVYVGCESRTLVPGRLASVRVLSARPQRVVVPGLDHAVASVAVRVRIVVAVDGGRLALVHTYHAVRAGGRWTWFLARPHFSEYLHGGCPGLAPSGPAL